MHDNYVLEWQTPYPVTITDDGIQAGSMFWFHKRNTSDPLYLPVPTKQIPVMPFKSDTAARAQFFISAWTADSMADFFLPHHGVAYWVTHDANPLNRTVEMTTTGLNTLLPGFEKAYGANQKVGVQFQPVRAGNFDVKSDGLLKFDMDIDINFKLQVHENPETGDGDYKDIEGWSEPVAQIYLKEMDLEIKLDVVNGNVTNIRLVDVWFPNMQVNSTWSGMFDFEPVANLFNFYFKPTAY